MFDKVLIWYDGSEGAQAALKESLELAKKFNADVTALWVKGNLPHYPETISEVEQERESANSFRNKLKNEISLYSNQFNCKIHFEAKEGHPAQTILHYAEEKKINLIVVGHRGHSNLWGKFLGHTADKISENARCNVLIVRK